MTDLISVIVPIFNVAPWLDRCMQSVFGQTYEALEIILVDDGSTDGCGTMCDRYAETDSRVRVVHQENRGLSGARNAGLDICTGDYVYYLDPDDYLDPDYIAIMHDAIKKHSADMAMGSVVCEYKNGKSRRQRLFNKKAVITGEEYLKAFLTNKGICCTAWSRMCTRNVAISIRFPEGQVYEDVAVAANYASSAKRVAFAEKAVYHHMVLRSGSITDTVSLQSIRDYFASTQMLYRFVTRNFPQYAIQARKWYRTTFVSAWKMLARHDQPSKEARVYRKKTRHYIQQHWRHYLRCRPKDCIQGYMIICFPRSSRMILRAKEKINNPGASSGVCWLRKVFVLYAEIPAIPPDRITFSE